MIPLEVPIETSEISGFHTGVKSHNSLLEDIDRVFQNLGIILWRGDTGSRLYGTGETPTVSASSQSQRSSLDRSATPKVSSKPRSAQRPKRRTASAHVGRLIRSAPGVSRRSICSSAPDHPRDKENCSRCPDFRYLDRHAKCFDHPHLHSKLISARPQKPCAAGGWCGRRTAAWNRQRQAATKQVSEGTDRVSVDENASQCSSTSKTRPRTVPTTVSCGFVCSFLEPF